MKALVPMGGSFIWSASYISKMLPPKQKCVISSCNVETSTRREVIKTADLLVCHRGVRYHIRKEKQGKNKI